jgi:hypothetical protein
MNSLFFVLGEQAEGFIEAGQDQQDLLENFTRRIAAGEFHGPADASIPVICKDGRFGGFHMLPNAAGGSETIFVADDLTNKLFGSSEGTTVAAYKNVLNHIVKNGGLVGGHDDDNDDATASGCGANDKLPFIYDLIARKGDHLRLLANQLGIEVSDETHEKIVRNAAARTIFSDGPEMLQALEDHDDEVIVEHLGGVHREVTAVMNTKDGTTLDRKAILDEFGEEYESFNVDVWSFKNAAEMLTDDPVKQHELVVGMVYYNLGTAHILGGKSLRIVVL